MAFRSRYGAGPLHLLVALASFAIAAYGLSEILGGSAPLNFVIWFVGAIVVHDLIAFPLYSLLGAIAGRGLQRRADSEAGPSALNHLRAPALLATFAFVVWFPLILGLASEEYEKTTGLTTEPYLGRWLALTGALFVISGVLYAIRLRRARG